MQDLDKGIWIDEKQAWIVFRKYNKTNLKAIGSDVETYHLRGGSRSSTPYGPQETVSETRLLRRKNQQLKNYYRRVLGELLPVSRVYLTGPAEAKVGLEKEILELKDLSLKTLRVETLDSMTKNQFKAKVRAFFDD